MGGDGPVDGLDVGAFGAVFREFLERVVHGQPVRRSDLAVTLGDHLGADVAERPVVGAVLSQLDHADLQLALDAYLGADGRTHRWIGLGANTTHAETFSDLVAHAHGGVGSPARRQVPVGVDELRGVVTSGAALVAGVDEPAHVVVVRTTSHGPTPSVVVDVLSARADHAEAVLEELRERMRIESVYRGQVVSLSPTDDPFGRVASAVAFLPRPDVAREDVVLPPGLLERIERRTLRFTAVAASLRAQGHDRRRGILLHGPPGTGKTLTVRYLVGQEADRTVVVLTGTALLMGIAPAMALARRLQPATVVLEDVDLVAQQRQHGHPHANPVLFTLLNELDGLGEDADVLVLLTTNRADLLEPALAARPGRVDLAVELPLPATAERRRLLARAARDVPTRAVDWDDVATRIAGTPASFVRELVRTAALHAALEGDGTVTGAAVDHAVEELLGSGSVTAALLGASRPAGATTDEDRGAGQ